MNPIRRVLCGVMLIAALIGQRSVSAAPDEAAIHADSTGHPDSLLHADSTKQARPQTAPISAPTHMRPGDKVYIQPSEFGLALSAAIIKKEVPVAVTTDSARAEFYIRTTSLGTHEGGGERIAKILVFGGFAGSGKHFEASVTVSNMEGTVVFAYSSKKENFQSAAEGVAKNLKKHIAEWLVRDAPHGEKR